MKNINRFLVSLASLLIFSGVALVTPAAAEHGDSTASGSSSRTSLADQTEPSSDSSTSGSSNSLTEQFRETAKQKLEAEKQDLKTHTEAEREKACTERKSSLTKRMNNAVEQAQRHKKVFDEIYTKVKNFYTTKNLNVSNYSTLTANVDTAQANAQASIDALSALNVNVDCASQTVASNVATFQQAVKSTRDSLKAYRAVLVNLITAIKGASTSTSDNTSTNSTAQ